VVAGAASAGFTCVATACCVGGSAAGLLATGSGAGFAGPADAGFAGSAAGFAASGFGFGTGTLRLATRGAATGGFRSLLTSPGGSGPGGP
jgi:hypothetical protein